MSQGHRASPSAAVALGTLGPQPKKKLGILERGLSTSRGLSAPSPAPPSLMGHSWKALRTGRFRWERPTPHRHPTRIRDSNHITPHFSKPSEGTPLGLHLLKLRAPSLFLSHSTPSCWQNPHAWPLFCESASGFILQATDLLLQATQ